MEEVEAYAQKWAMQIFELNSSTAVSALAPPTPPETSRSEHSVGTVAVHSVGTCPKRLHLSLLEFKALLQNACKPPAVLGVETGGPAFRAARKYIENVVRALRLTTSNAMAICVWGDPCSPTELNKMENIVPRGTFWAKKEKKLKVNFGWVHNTEAATPMFYHNGDTPLFVFHNNSMVRHELVLDIVKGNNFLELFPSNSPERVRKTNAPHHHRN